MKHQTALSIHWFALVAVLGFVANASADPIVSDAGFTTPNLSGGYQYNPSGSGWTFSTFSSGISGAGMAANASAFNVVGSPSGQAGFLQQVNAKISQLISGFQSSLYTLTFEAEGRNNNAGANPIQVTVGGTTLTFGSSTTITPPLGTFTTYTSNPFSVSPGSNLLTFTGVGVGSSDVTTFIVDPKFTAVPEPSTLVVYAVGFVGLLAFAGCRRRFLCA